MTEEKALEFWRALAPLDAVVRREHELGDGDPVAYEVSVPAQLLKGAEFIPTIKLAEQHGLEIALETECGEGWLTFFSPDPKLAHPAAPKS